MASVEIIPGFLPRRTCEQLVEGFRQRQDLTAKFEDEGLKHFDGRVFWTSRFRPHLKDLAKDAAKRIADIIEGRLSDFPVRDDDPQIVRWHPPHEMPPHTDLYYGRLYAAHVALTDGFEGGHLWFPGEDMRRRPELGTLFVFPADTVNALEQVTAGELFFLSTWFHRAD
jgi:hypothetical protein